MATRPLVTVYTEKNEPTGTQIKVPEVLVAPIRPDVVSFVHDQLRKNRRQASGVSTKAGMCFALSFPSHDLFQVTRLLLNLGVLDVLLPVFLVSVVVEPTAPVRVPSVTCAVVVICSLL